MRRLANIIWWLGLSTYFGGMLALGAIAAPAIFQTVRKTGATLPAMPPWLNASDQLGGEIFGNVLAKFQTMECFCLVIMAIALVLIMIQRRDFRNGARLGVLILLASLVVGDMLMTPHILRYRQVNRTIDSASLRADFDDLHKSAVNRGKLKIVLLLALVTISAWKQKPAPTGTATVRERQAGSNPVGS